MLETLTQFFTVAILMWSSPGPNNMMLTNSGARFGFTQTLPHMAGIVVGTILLLASSISVLNPILMRWPVVMLGLKIIGSLWLVYLGWKMATATRIANADAQAKPMSFVAAVLFQFANPKAYSAMIALLSILLKEDVSLMAVFLAIGIAPIFSFGSIVIWVLAGMQIRRFLSTDNRWKWFSWISGGLVAACAILVWI